MYTSPFYRSKIFSFPMVCEKKFFLIMLKKHKLIIFFCLSCLTCKAIKEYIWNWKVPAGFIPYPYRALYISLYSYCDLILFRRARWMRRTVLERTKGISSFLQNGAARSLDLPINPEKSLKLMLFGVPQNTQSNTKHFYRVLERATKTRFIM